MAKYRYKNVFIYSSLQFCGNIEEYFASNSQKLVAYVMLPRLKSKHNFIHYYKSGKLVSRISVLSSENIFLYYVLWYLNYLRCLFMFDSRDKIIVLSSHPISFFGMSIQKIFRRITYAFWICDYFPGEDVFIKMYEGVKRYYHKRIALRYYLSDGINRVFNGDIVRKSNARTVMWGVKPIRTPGKKSKSFSILFVGLIKESQGIEFILDFLKTNKGYKVNIIGICNDALHNKYMRTIRRNKIEKQVFFPNTFYSDADLQQLASQCHIGIGLYNADASNPTYYTDPGKIKAYTELGLPVIMTEVSGIAVYIKKCKAGILINRNNAELAHAIIEIKKNYTSYVRGVKKFNGLFYYENYYKESFKSLEGI